MRIFLSFLIIFLTFLELEAQIKVDFAHLDGNLPSIIKGDISDFNLEDGSLRLRKSGTSGQSYISIAFELGNTCSWMFHVKQQYNPSIYNYVELALFAPYTNLKEEQEGMYLRLGGRSDEICLFERLEGRVHEIMQLNQVLSLKQNEVKVIVTKSGKEWKLRIQGTEESYQATELYESLWKGQGYLGLKCIYTKTNSEAFYCYSIAQESKNTIIPPDLDIEISDTTLLSSDYSIPKYPYPSELEVATTPFLDATKFLLIFNQPIRYTGSQFLCPEDLELTITPTQYAHILHVESKASLPETFLIFWSQVYSPSGELLSYGQVSITTNTEPLPPNTSHGRIPQAWGELLITEIMANPKGNLLYPEVEYIEVYNATNDTLSLEKTSLVYGAKTFCLEEVPSLAPHTYQVWCHQNKASLLHPEINRIGISGFPALLNTGKYIALRSPQQELLHYVDYSDQWYREDYAEEGGYSLELMSLKYIASDPLHWSESIDPLGCTPGRKNSQVELSCEISSANYIQSFYPVNANTIEIWTHTPLHPFNKPEVWFSQDRLSYESKLPNYGTYYRISSVDTILPEKLTLRTGLNIDSVPLCPFPVLKTSKGLPVKVGKLIITEVNLSALDANYRYIECYNPDTVSYDVEGLWVEIEDLTYDKTVHFSLSPYPNVILPQSYALVAVNPFWIFQDASYTGCPQLWLQEELPQLKKDHSYTLRITDLSENGTIDEIAYIPSSKPFDYPDSASYIRLRKKSSKEYTHLWQWSSIGSIGVLNQSTNLVTDDSTSSNSNQRLSLVNSYVSLRENHQASSIVLNYHLVAENSSEITITLFTRSGAKVARLGSRIPIQGEGLLSWSNEWRTKQSSLPGIYILLVEEVINGSMQKRHLFPMSIIP